MYYLTNQEVQATGLFDFVVSSKSYFLMCPFSSGCLIHGPNKATSSKFPLSNAVGERENKDLPRVWTTSPSLQSDWAKEGH